MSLNSSKWGREALIKIPPKECPKKLILAKQEMGQNDWIYYFTSLANLSPISKMSPSV